MSDSAKLAERIGRIALAQAELDEWLVQVLISLLKPLPESRVQLLVSNRSLDQKCRLIRDIANDLELALDEKLEFGDTPNQLLREIKKLNDERDRAVHSYYDRINHDQTQRFRSRKPEVEPVQLSDLETLAENLSRCSGGLHDLVERFEKGIEDQLEASSRWNDPVRGTHEVITAGHLLEREMVHDLAQSMDDRRPVRVAICGPRRRFLKEEEKPLEGEFVANIDSSNWSANITSPDGEQIQFGDTGWRNITELAQEEDSSVKYAAIRRIDNTVLISFEGGEFAAADLPQIQNRLAKRAFGPGVDSTLKAPSWLMNLDGFRPN